MPSHNTLFRQAIMQVRNANQGWSHLRRQYCAKFGETASPFRDLVKEDEFLHEMANSYIENLVCTAEQRFGVNGVPLRIDRKPISDRFAFSWRDDINTFDPDAVWVYLEENYQHQGADIARQQLAEKVIKNLSLRHATFKKVKGRVVLPVTTYLESHTTTPQYGYGSRDKLRDIFVVLSELAEAHDKPAMASELKQAKSLSVISGWGHTITSRERFAIGTVAELVTMQKVAEIHMCDELSDMIRQFVGSYGQLDKD